MNREQIIEEMAKTFQRHNGPEWAASWDSLPAVSRGYYLVGMEMVFSRLEQLGLAPVPVKE